ncbi:MAG: phosphatidylglycerophosphatase A [Rickettsiaceae bacterium]|nr:phosphatidylglycerophosphatase A [Rickettsiaceae bacterium]
MNLIKFIVTGFGVGLFPYFSGTLGSLIAFPISYLILIAASKTGACLHIESLNESGQELAGIFGIYIIVFIIILISGIYLSDIYAKYTRKQDPKEVVIDEIMGQMLTLIISFPTLIFAHKSYLGQYLRPEQIDVIFLFCLPFFFFRFFDILKPWPIGDIDKNIKGGFGIMLDDFVAGIFAGITCYIVTFILIA